MLINGCEVDVSKYKEVKIDGELFWKRGYHGKEITFNSNKKSCSKCKEIKELDEFGNGGKLFLKKRYTCKKCDRKYREKNKDKVKEWREKNKDKIKEYCKDYQEKNKDKIKEWREKNKDKIKEYGKDYQEKNKDKIKEYHKDYQKKNKDKIKEYREKNKEYKKGYHKEWREKNKEHRKEYYKDYQEKNKEYKKGYHKEWREKNKEKIDEYRDEYRKKNKEKIDEYKKKHYNSPALYNTYAHKLSIDEECKKDGEYLSVKCTYCGRYFKPTNGETRSRIAAINSLNKGECRLYCSDGCKAECPVYNSKGSPTNTKLARESNPVLRQTTLKRDNYTCQKCHSTTNLHCHHIVPVKIDPGMSEDIDNCITFCRSCHYKIHGMVDGCGLGELRMAEDKCLK